MTLGGLHVYFFWREMYWTVFRCRYCNYAVIVEVAKNVNKVFKCNRCLAEICRICGKDWDERHIGHPCLSEGRNKESCRRELWVWTVLTEFGSFHMKSSRSKPQGCSCWIAILHHRDIHAICQVDSQVSIALWSTGWPIYLSMVSFGYTRNFVIFQWIVLKFLHSLSTRKEFC